LKRKKGRFCEGDLLSIFLAKLVVLSPNLTLISEGSASEGAFLSKRENE